MPLFRFRAFPIFFFQQNHSYSNQLDNREKNVHSQEEILLIILLTRFANGRVFTIIL